MNKVRKEKILKLLDAEINKIQESAKKTDEASKQRLTGWSAAGDKYHAIGAADLAKSYLNSLELLKNELKKSPEKVINVANPPCYMRTAYDSGDVADLILVENAVSLPSVSFISTGSPLGKAIIGKKKGDHFQYELESGKKYSGSILLLE